MRTIATIVLFLCLSSVAFGFPAKIVRNVANNAKLEAKDLYEEVVTVFKDGSKEHQAIRSNCKEFMSASQDYFIYAPNAYVDGGEKARLIHLEKLNRSATRAFDSLKAVGYQSPAFIKSEGSIKALNDLIHAFDKPLEPKDKKS